MPDVPDNDRRHLHRALTLAREAAAFASPNPTVGCVLTSPSGELLGEGAHFYDRRNHAEIAALKAAAEQGHSVQGATAYVTLEPCTITGRTGPCADALIAAGIARCVLATADPNPAVHGNGIARLRAAGIDVTVLPATDPLATEARRLNDAFAFSIVHGRPFVTLKAALSVDGKLAPPPAQRNADAAPHWLTGEAARADVQQFRHASDAILTGIGTILADNPSLTDRTGLLRRRPLLRVVLDRNLRTPPTAAVLIPNPAKSPSTDPLAAEAPTTVISTGAKRSGEIPAFDAASTHQNTLLLTTPTAPPENAAALENAHAKILRLPELTPATVLAELHHRQIRSVLLEAGPTLNAAFLHAGLADRIILYFAEAELGPNALPFAAGGPSPYELQQRLTTTTRTTFPYSNGEDVRITGYLRDPWASLNPNPQNPGP